jgi:hypothetical protein
MRYIPERQAVVDDATGIEISRRGRAELPDEIPLGLKDPSADPAVMQGGYIYFTTQLRLDGNGLNPRGSDLSKQNLAIAFSKYTKNDPTIIAKIQNLLMEGVTLYLKESVGIANPEIRWVK